MKKDLSTLFHSIRGRCHRNCSISYFFPPCLPSLTLFLASLLLGARLRLSTSSSETKLGGLANDISFSSLLFILTIVEVIVQSVGLEARVGEILIAVCNVMARFYVLLRLRTRELRLSCSCLAYYII